MPAKALTEEKKQAGKLLEEKLVLFLEEAKVDKRVFSFAGAAHFVYGAFVACLWSLAQIFVPTPSGRNMYNVLGAIDTLSHGLVTVCNTK
ncbi:hypothetical protein FACS189435_1720 [Bacteroidia bacterium]|nr:hypothetical protein FACS189435_1720 [Bacteroidia bacterium]